MPPPRGGPTEEGRAVVGADALVLEAPPAAWSCRGIHPDAEPRATTKISGTTADFSEIAHVLSDFPALAVKAEKAVQLDPYNPYTRNITALMYLDIGEQLGNPAYISRSERLFTEGLTYLPDEPNLTVGLSDLYIRVGRPEEAVRLLTDYLRLDPYMADAHFNMGLAYLNLREPAQAAKHLEDCVRIVPSDAEAFFYLGKAYEQSGKQERATAAFESAARLDPRFRDEDSSAPDAS